VHVPEFDPHGRSAWARRFTVRPGLWVARAEQLRANGSSAGLRDNRRLPNKRLKLAARVDYGMKLLSARRSLSAIR